MTRSTLDDLLHAATGGRLQKIVRTAQKMERLTLRIRETVGPEAGLHVVAASLHDNGELVVICDSSAWAARLRYDQERLLACARREAPGVTCVRVRVGSP